MGHGSSARSDKNGHAVLTVECPRCRTKQKVHVAARGEFGQISGERIPCINCNNRFKVAIPDKIIRGPFPI